jgi:hypothetical protein
LDFGGTHHLSNDPTATATFTFTGKSSGLRRASVLQRVLSCGTGAAVYVVAPQWPYQVGMSLTLDGGAPLVIDLQDLTVSTTNGGPEDLAWAVVADANGLNSSHHQLVVSMPSGYSYMVVDGFM